MNQTPIAWALKNTRTGKIDTTRVYVSEAVAKAAAPIHSMRHAPMTAVPLFLNSPALDEQANMRRFHNRLRILLNIEREELAAICEDAGFDDRVWVSFRESPWRWFIKACDEHAAGLWRIIRAREGLR